MIDIFLKQRLVRPVPARFGPIADDPTGGVRLESRDQINTLRVVPIYTAEAESVQLELPDGPCLLIDFRFIDFVLHLIAAFEIDNEDDRQTAVMMHLYGLVVEQSLRSPPRPLHVGVLLDFLVSRVSAKHLYGYEEPKGESIWRAEFVTRLVAAHEAAHGWISVDPEYRDRLIESLSLEVKHLGRFTKGPEDAGTLIARAASAAEALLATYDGGALNSDLEELLCDLAMVEAVANAVIRSRTGMDKMHAYLCLTAGTLASIWVVSLVQSATRRLFETGADLDVLQTHNRETRNVLAMMAFARLIGVEATTRRDDGLRTLLEALRDVPDYNELCVETINLLFSAANLERLMDIGDVAGFANFSEPVAAVASIRALFGWT